MVADYYYYYAVGQQAAHAVKEAWHSTVREREGGDTVR